MNKISTFPMVNVWCRRYRNRKVKDFLFVVVLRILLNCTYKIVLHMDTEFLFMNRNVKVILYAVQSSSCLVLVQKRSALLEDYVPNVQCICYQEKLECRLRNIFMVNIETWIIIRCNLTSSQNKLFSTLDWFCRDTPRISMYSVS